MKLLDKAGKEVATAQVNGSGTATMSVANPLKWSAEAPNLYTLVVNLEKGGKVIESLTQKVGFRKIELKNAQVLVNGQADTRADRSILPEDVISLKEKSCPYVSRGGLKLAHALKTWNISLKDKICVVQTTFSFFKRFISPN